MSKKILALALFAIMVFSIVPFAGAASTGAADVVKIEMVNTNQTDANTDNAPRVTKEGSSLTDGTNVLTLSHSFNKLNKTSKDYYSTDYVKYDVYAYISYAIGNDTTNWDSLAEYTLSGNSALSMTGTQFDAAKTSGKVLLNDVADGNTAVQNVATGIKELTNFSDLTVNGSKLSDTAIRDAELVIIKVDNVYQLCVKIMVGTFEFTSADAKTTYTVKYKYGSSASNARTTIIETVFKNTDVSDKPVKDMYFTASRTGLAGIYNIYEQSGVLYIDYSIEAVLSAAVEAEYSVDGKEMAGRLVIPVNFTFWEDSSKTVRIPASGQRAYLSTESSGSPLFEVAAANEGRYASVSSANDTYQDFLKKLDPEWISPANLKNLNINRDNGRIEVKNNESATIGIVVPYETVKQTRQTMTLVVEGKDYEYETAEKTVIFRPLPANTITTAIVDQREITIRVGESATITASSASATTFDNIILSEVTSVRPYLHINGKTITGTNVGTTTVQVMEGTLDRVLDQITVHVVAAGTTAPAETASTWRVVCRTLNVRSGPGTNYGKVSTLSMNTVVTGDDMGNGWVQIGANQFVSKSFLTPVSATTAIGTYTVSASSLNVRSGPGGSYAKIGSLPKNSVVEVVSVQNGWSQLASGGWVSSIYIK